MESDPVRAAIDSGVAQVLGIPDPTVIRTLLGQEPVVSNVALGIEPSATEEAAAATLQFELL